MTGIARIGAGERDRIVEREGMADAAVRGWCDEWAETIVARITGETDPRMYAAITPADVEIAANTYDPASPARRGIQTYAAYLAEPDGLCDTYAHVAVYHRGRWYDAECLAGVRDWHDLPYVVRELRRVGATR